MNRERRAGCDASHKASNRQIEAMEEYANQVLDALRLPVNFLRGSDDPYGLVFIGIHKVPLWSTTDYRLHITYAPLALARSLP